MECANSTIAPPQAVVQRYTPGSAVREQVITIFLRADRINQPGSPGSPGGSGVGVGSEWSTLFGSVSDSMRRYSGYPGTNVCVRVCVST